MAYLFMQFLRLPSGISENILRKECRSQYGGYWLFFNEKGVYFWIPNQRFPNEIARNVKKMVGFPQIFEHLLDVIEYFSPQNLPFFPFKSPEILISWTSFYPNFPRNFSGAPNRYLKNYNNGRWDQIRYANAMQRWNLGVCVYFTTYW